MADTEKKEKVYILILQKYIFVLINYNYSWEGDSEYFLTGDFLM